MVEANTDTTDVKQTRRGFKGLTIICCRFSDWM